MTALEPATAEEFRVKLGEMLWDAVDRMATGDDPLASLTFLTKRLPIGALHCSPYDDALADTRPRGQLSADHFLAHCTRAVLALLDRPEVRTQLRDIAENPKRAKRHKRVLAIARATRPEIFAEAPPTTAKRTASTDATSGELVRGLGKSSPPAIRVHFAPNLLTTTTPDAEAVDRVRIRAKSAAAYKASIPVLEEIANDPNASEKDRRNARRIRKKYKHLEPPKGAA